MLLPWLPKYFILLLLRISCLGTLSFQCYNGSCTLRVFVHEFSYLISLVSTEQCMVLFHQQKETLRLGMCFTQELLSSWIVGLLLPDFQPSVRTRRLLQSGGYDVLSTDMISKQSWKCTGQFGRTWPAVWKRRELSPPPLASLNLLQTWVSVCLVICQPCGWHMLPTQSSSMCVCVCLCEWRPVALV